MTTTVAGATHDYADLGDVKLHYVAAGEGPVVVLLHGFPDFWYSWRHQIPALARAGFRAVAPDLRGYNLSDKPKGVGDYAVERLTDDVRKFAEHLEADRIHLVGHDWGAIVAWFFAMDDPDVLDRLAILNGPHPARFLEMARTPSQLRRSWYVTFFQIPLLPEKIVGAADFFPLRRLLSNERSAFDETEIEAYVQAARNADALKGPINYYRALWRRNPLALRRDKRVIARDTLVLWGEKDRALTERFAEPPAELVPSCRVIRFPDAGHWVHLEQPDDVNRELVAFLS